MKDDASWVLEASLSQPVEMIAGSLAVACQLWAVWRLFQRPTPLAWRLGCGASRLIAMVLSLTLIAKPTLVRRKTEPEAARVDIVIDTSASMKDPSRLPKAMPGLVRGIDTFKQKHPELTLKSHHLSGSLDEPLLPSHDAWALDTDLLAAVEKAVRSPGPTPRGVLLISDGADHAELSQRLSSGDTSRPQIPRLAHLGVPVSTVGIGLSAEGPDIAIEQVAFDGLAFIKVAQAIEVTCSISGMPAGESTVSLMYGSRVLATTPLRWQDARQKTQHIQLKLPLRLETIDAFPLELRIPVQPREIRTDNNRFPFVVHSTRDKLRVLHVAGHPSWDARFLREQLKALPYIDLVSFFILRTYDNDLSTPEQELALIPFPTEQLFTSELKNFDLIVLHDFDPRPFGMARFLPNVARAVENAGLGLAMIGGSHSFGAGGYGSSALAPLLPLQPTIEQDAHHDMVRLSPTALGRRHRVSSAVAALVATGPSLTQHHRPLSPAPGSEVLLEAKDLGSNTMDTFPLLALGQFGQGRTLALATDAMWRWHFSTEATEATRAAYAQLWREALKYLSGDVAEGPVRLELSRHTFNTEQDPITGRVSIAAANGRASKAKQVQLFLRTADGEMVANKILDVDARGEAAFALSDVVLGSYILEARLTEDTASKPAASAQEALAVRPTSPEQLATQPQPLWLAAMAKLTGGHALSDTQVESALERMALLPAPSPRLLGLERRSVWDHPAVLIAWLAAWFLTWWLERRATQAKPV